MKYITSIKKIGHEILCSLIRPPKRRFRTPDELQLLRYITTQVVQTVQSESDHPDPETARRVYDIATALFEDTNMAISPKMAQAAVNISLAVEANSLPEAC